MRFYLERGDEALGTFDHAYWNNGYVELNYGLWPARDRDAFAGPFRVRGSSPTPLVVAATYGPATPYHGALRLVRDLSSARLITMRGDGHTAYGGESACIDSAVETYLNDGVLPSAGTVCRQQTPFTAPAARQGAQALGRRRAARQARHRLPRPTRLTRLARGRPRSSGRPAVPRLRRARQRSARAAERSARPQRSCSLLHVRCDGLRLRLAGAPARARRSRPDGSSP